MADVKRQSARNGMGHGSGIVGEKPKNMKKALKDMAKYLKPFMVSVVFAIILSIASSILSIIGPNKISDLANTILAGVPTEYNPNPGPINLNMVGRIAVILLIVYGSTIYYGKNG